jgi:hypothetical protein
MKTIIKILNRKHELKFVTTLALFLFSGNFHAQIYINGLFSTGLTSSSGVTSPSGYTWSEAQSNTGNTTECNKSTGFSAYFNTAGTTNFQIADDFTIPAAEQWTISGFDFFIHQNSYTGSVIPIDQLRIQLWLGDPSVPSSTLVAGDMTTNVLDVVNSAGNTFIYRIPSSLLGSPVIGPNTNRKVWKVRGNISTTLTPGTYWVVYQFHATDNGTIFAPPVTVLGSRGLAGWNAKQNFVANTSPGVVLGWANILDIGYPDTAPDVPQDLPFLINGTINPLGVNQNDFSTSIVLHPNPLKNQLSITASSIDKIDGIEIFDLTGRKVNSIEAINSTINVSELSAGNYILKIKSGSQVTVKRFVKE